MITKPEVRAVVLARLGPRLGDVVWDVGAGQRLGRRRVRPLRADVHAVERDPDDAERVRRNADAHGVPCRVTGAAPAALERLPDPDAVFVGGGGLAVVEACVARRPARLVVALATVEQVAPVLAATAAYAPSAVLVQVSALSPLGQGHRLVPGGPVFVLSGALHT
jgi:precorrin-6Y C5,15-methyltransferase (decarboxylating)